MTRINVVPVEELENMHLMAEYRELPRVFNLARNYYYSKNRNDKKIPIKYTLGTGHVKFFYNKLLWLANRQEQLVQELLKRGYKISFTESKNLLNNMPLDFCNDYKITKAALKINRQRIALRLKEYDKKNLLKK